MKVKKLSGKVQDAQQIPTLFDNENITYHPINIVNWKEYPYQPQVSFRIAYTNDAILVHYKVVEDSVRAKYGEDNGSVWTDSSKSIIIMLTGHELNNCSEMAFIIIWNVTVSLRFF
jgi:hypothetical protein